MTVRTKSELLSLYADNTTGAISEGDLRDFVDTAYDRFGKGPRDFREFGAVEGLNAVAAAATTAAWEDWVLNSDEDLFIPSIGTQGFYFDAMEPPRRSIFGEGVRTSGGSSLYAATGFAPRSKTFFDCHNLGWRGSAFDSESEVYRGFRIDAKFQTKHTLGIDVETSAGTFAGIHLFSGLQIQGADSSGYSVFGVGGTAPASPLVGARFEQCSIRAAGGAGLIALQVSVDDVTFAQPRLEMLGGDMDKVPIIIDQSINIQFLNPFWRNQSDFKAGSGPHIFQVKGGSSVVLWDGGLVEWAHLTYTGVRHFFFVESGALDAKNIRFDGDSASPPVFTEASICRVLADTNVAQASLSNIRQNNITGVSALFEVKTGDTGGAGVSDIYVENCPAYGTLIVSPSGAASSGKTVARAQGFHRGIAYNHKIQHDGTNILVFEAAQNTVETTAANHTLVLTDSGKTKRMNVPTSGAIVISTAVAVPFDAGTEINFLNVNAGALNIVGVSGVTVNGSAVFQQRDSGQLLYTDIVDEWDIIRHERN